MTKITDRSHALQGEYEMADREHARRALAPRLPSQPVACSAPPAAQYGNRARVYGLLARLRNQPLLDRHTALMRMLLDTHEKLKHELADLNRRHRAALNRLAAQEAEIKALRERADLGESLQRLNEQPGRSGPSRLSPNCMVLPR